MKLDSSWILAIIALIAIISPIATALINNHHQKKMKLIDYAQHMNEDLNLHSREIIEQYLHSAGDAVLHLRGAGSSLSSDYYHSYYIALANASPDVQGLMELANRAISRRDTDEASRLISEIAVASRSEFLNSYKQMN